MPPCSGPPPLEQRLLLAGNWCTSTATACSFAEGYSGFATACSNSVVLLLLAYCCRGVLHVGDKRDQLPFLGSGTPSRRLIELRVEGMRL